jgi:hypothetical protein
MYQNARTRFKTEAERGCFSIVQEMVFQAQGVRAIIYPHSVRDLDFARLDLGILKARLVRELSPGGPPRRVLDLRVTSALIRRWTPKTPFAEKDELTPRLWIEQASSGNKALIFELPPMVCLLSLRSAHPSGVQELMRSRLLLFDRYRRSPWTPSSIRKGQSSTTTPCSSTVPWISPLTVRVRISPRALASQTDPHALFPCFPLDRRSL